MTATQVQRRRGTQAQCDGMTPAEAEAVIDLTNDRWRIGDGLTAGGIHVPNFNDIRRLAGNTGTVGGTGNAITLTNYPALGAYATYVSFRFIAANSNTGATTLNVDGLGTRNIVKVSAGSIVSLGSGDIVAGGVYEVTYDATNTRFILLNIAPISSVSVGQGDIRNATGSFSTTINVPTSGVTWGNSAITAPGGSWGFDITASYPTTGGSEGVWIKCSAGFSNAYRGAGIAVTGSASSGLLSGFQRYVDASPPYDMGDGEAAGFFYVLLNESGEIVGHYAASVPPWAYNGKTSVTPDYIDPVTKKKYNIRRDKTLDEIMDGAKSKSKLLEIGDDVKNADIDLIPQPFIIIPTGHRVVMLDPMDDKIRRLMDHQNRGGGMEIVEAISSGKIIVENDKCKRCAPKGVDVHKMKYKHAGKF